MTFAETSNPGAETQNPGRRRRKIALAISLGVATFGLYTASAASLGGLTAKNLGADDNVVASCDTDGVTVAYTNAYDATAGLYKTSVVTVSGIAAACNGQTMSITLKDATGVSLGNGTATVAGTTSAVTLSTTANSKLVVGAAIVISG